MALPDNCRSCGAALGARATEKTVRCRYCGTHSYDEHYAEARLSSLDLSKAGEVLKLAKVRLESGRIEDAIELLSESLKENSECVEAWGCLAVCRVETLKISNFDKNLIAVVQCISQIKHLAPEQAENYFSEIYERFLARSLNLTYEHVERAAKVYRAFSGSRDIKAVTDATDFTIDGIRMINSALELKGISHLSNLKSSVTILSAILHIDEVAKAPRLAEYRRKAAGVISEAMARDRQRAMTVITNFALDRGKIVREIEGGAESPDEAASAAKLIAAIVILIGGIILLAG